MNFDFLNRGAMLAPMAGVTDMPFRVLCHEMGCPMAVSEMVSAKGYLLAPKDNRATRELLSVDERERGAVALQLFGHEPEIMARAAEELTRGGRYALLDINMGCPVPKIVGNGDGCALMRDEALAAKIREIWPSCDVRIGANRGLCSYYCEPGGVLVGFEG